MINIQCGLLDNKALKSQYSSLLHTLWYKITRASICFQCTLISIDENTNIYYVGPAELQTVLYTLFLMQLPAVFPGGSWQCSSEKPRVLRFPEAPALCWPNQLFGHDQSFLQEKQGVSCCCWGRGHKDLKRQSNRFGQVQCTAKVQVTQREAVRFWICQALLLCLMHKSAGK